MLPSSNVLVWEMFVKPFNILPHNFAHFFVFYGCMRLSISHGVLPFILTSKEIKYGTKKFFFYSLKLSTLDIEHLNNDKKCGKVKKRREDNICDILKACNY